MFKIGIRIGVFSSLSLIFAIAAPTVQSKPAPKVSGKLIRSITFVGTSANKKKELRFKGNEKLYQTGNQYTKLTQYFSSAGKPLLWDKVTFSTDLEPASYVRWGSDSAFDLEFKRASKNYTLMRPGKKTVSKKWEDAAIVPKVLHEFVIRHKAELAKGNKKGIQLFLPDISMFANFWVVPTVSGNQVVIRLKIRNLLLRAFVPKVEFAFDKNTGDVLSYEGPALFEMKHLSEKRIRIDFKTQK